MKIYLLAGLVAGLLSATSAQAFDPSHDPRYVLAAVQALDCNEKPLECRYLSAVEVAAYVDVCPAELDKRFEPNADKMEGKVEVQKWLADWKALTPPDLRAAVLSPNNKLRKFFSEKIARVLEVSPDDDVGLECSRLIFVRDQAPVEGLSDFIMMAKNPPPAPAPETP